MTTTNSANYLEQTQRRARQFLDTNNSLTSKISDEMISLLEAGEGSFYLRDQIDNILNDVVRNNTLRGAVNPNTTRLIGYDWAKLRQLMSIKDKISYIVAIETTRDNTTRGNPTNVVVPEDDIKEKINTVIGDLETRLLNNQEFTESWILRHAAINRFACKVKDADKAKLNTFSSKIQKLCTDSGFDILAESVHFTFESDAQKIIKTDETIKQLSAMGIVIPDDIISEFEKFAEYIKPLKELDGAYKHMSKTLNMIHKIAKVSNTPMITPNQQRRISAVLQETDMTETINKALSDFNDPQNFDKNEEHTYIDNLLAQIKKSPKFEQALINSGLQETVFTDHFLSWMGYQLTHGAKQILSFQKNKTFGEKTPDFEKDTQSWRGMMRNRIFEVYNRNAAQNGAASREWDFADDADFDLMNSYFTKFPDLFFVKEEDNYRNIRNIPGQNPDQHILHFDKMRSIVSAIVRRRIPALRGSNRITRGSHPRRALNWIEHAFQGDTRGVLNRIRRQWQHTDDASIIAMIIMAQNETTNKMFYEDKDPFQKTDRRYSRIFRGIAGTERGRQSVVKTFGPAANTALKATEITAKGAIGLTTLGVQKTASMVNVPLEKLNGWLSKQSNWNPMKLGMIATKPMQRFLNPLSKGVKYTDKDGNEKRIKISEALNKGYNSAKDALPEKEGEEKKTKYLYERATRGIGSVSEFFGNTISNTSQRIYDTHTTNQQGRILSALYRAAGEESRWNDLMQSSELTDILNIKNRGPYLFDDDGRILPIDKPEEEDKDIKAGKDLIKRFEEQLQRLQKGIDDKDDLLSKKLENATISSDQNELLNKKSQLDSRKGSVLSIRIGLEQLIPALKKPGTTQNQTIIGNIIGTCTPAAQQNQPATYTGLKQNIYEQLNQVTTRRNVINSNQTQNLGAQQNPATSNENIKRDLQWIIRSAESEIDQQNNIIATNPGNGNNGQNQTNRANALNEIKRKENRIKQAEARIRELNQELIDLSSWESRLRKILTLVTTLRDDQNNLHLDVDTLKSLANSLELTLYKPFTIQQTTQQTANNITNTLAA